MSETQTQLSAPTWHESLWQPMARAIRGERVAHGLLVCGPPGVGKRHFAARIVAALLCRDRQENADACGVCPACRQRLAGTHPDISRLVPDEPGRMIRVEQVRAFSRRLYLTPQYDAGRIGWIEPVENLSPSAANILLKTLEEPPSSCHIVLVTDRLSALMSTVRSRCQPWRVPPPPPQRARDWLESNGTSAAGLDADSLRTPFAVIERNSRDYDTLSSDWDDTLSNVIRNREDTVSAAQRLAKSPADLFIDWLYRRASALLTVALAPADTAGDTSERGGPDLPAPLMRIAQRLDPAALQPWCAQVSEAARLAHTNADWQLVIESLLLNLKNSLKRKPS